MKAVMQAAGSQHAGSAEIVVAGGMESMTNAPYVLPKRVRVTVWVSQIKDHMFLDGLEDAETGRLMGSFAQDMANTRGYTREQMDDFAIRSLQRAQRLLKVILKMRSFLLRFLLVKVTLSLIRMNSL